jgi:hypothetical protein
VSGALRARIPADRLLQRRPLGASCAGRAGIVSRWSKVACSCLVALVLWPTAGEAGEAPSRALPEPMVFDLVRPLGAKKGEFEANTLAAAPLPDGGVSWAPEIEYAFADGHAIELELPMHGGSVEALKLALQGTFGADRGFIHGWQGIGEFGVGGTGRALTGLYIAGLRLDDTFSVLTMVGGRHVSGIVQFPALAQTAMLVNASAWAELTSSVTVGLETNVEVHRGREALLMPQVHWQLPGILSIQAGVGARIGPWGMIPVPALRVIAEL